MNLELMILIIFSRVSDKFITAVNPLEFIQNPESRKSLIGDFLKPASNV